MMGWSHGGYITLLSVFREKHPFKAGAAIVPVTNLVFRLSYKGPSYQWDFSTQKEIQGLPFEKPELYIQRSPLYHVDKLQVPLLVHVATNDLDVNYVEDQQIVDALRSRKPDLAETKIYVIPPRWGASGGHASAGGWTRTRSNAWNRRTRSTRGTGRGPSSSGTCGRTRTARSPSPTWTRRRGDRDSSLPTG